MSNNPYSKASQAYNSVEKTGRDLEAEVLFKSASRMELVAKAIESGEKVRAQDIGDIFNANQKIWQVFLDNMLDDDAGIPQEIRDNIGSLAVFTFKHTLDILAKPTPDKIQTLIDINRNIATGLSKKTVQEAPKKAPEAEKGTSPQPQAGTKKPPQEGGEEHSKPINIDL